MQKYLLPFHPSLLTDDPLWILDESDNSQAAVLKALLSRAQKLALERPDAACGVLIDLLGDIAYTIHGNGSLDSGHLKWFLGSQLSPSKAQHAVRNIIHAALELGAASMPLELEQLSCPQGLAHIQGSFATSLLAHAALGTLSVPAGSTWGIPGYTSWYADGSCHRNAVDGYLNMLFDFFQCPEDGKRNFCIRLTMIECLPDLDQCCAVPVFEFDLVDQIRDPSSQGGKDAPFVLVAANREPGPGPTGTQEERIQAMSPWLILCSLLCPVIPDNAAIITSAMPVLGRWTGHNRTAKLEEIFETNARPLRHYILADALSLDEVESDEHAVLPDYKPGNVEREIKKLYAAFCGALRVSRDAGQSKCTIEALPWGCGAFGGNFVVKMKCMMIAAGLAGVSVRVFVTNERLDDVQQLKRERAQQPLVKDLWKELSRRCQEFTDP